MARRVKEEQADPVVSAAMAMAVDDDGDAGAAAAASTTIPPGEDHVVAELDVFLSEATDDIYLVKVEYPAA